MVDIKTIIVIIIAIVIATTVLLFASGVFTRGVTPLGETGISAACNACIGLSTACLPGKVDTTGKPTDNTMPSQCTAACTPQKDIPSTFKCPGYK